MYKIYINESLIILADSETKFDLDSDNKLDMTLRYTGKKKILHQVIDSAEKSRNFNRVVIRHQNLKTLWNEFKSIFELEVAAGGLVLNPNKKALLIFRRNNWDLPKGKQEKNESIKETAIREVKEETGVKKIKILAKLDTTYHTYKDKKGKRILKKTVWYLMSAPIQKLKPQTEEDIEIARWKNLKKFLLTGPVTYRNISDLLWDYYENINFSPKTKMKSKGGKKSKTIGKKKLTKEIASIDK